MVIGAWTTMITVRVLRALIHCYRLLGTSTNPVCVPDQAQTRAVSPFPSGAVGCLSPAKGPTAPGPPLG